MPFNELRRIRSFPVHLLLLHNDDCKFQAAGVTVNVINQRATPVTCQTRGEVKPSTTLSIGISANRSIDRSR
ncbi:hypothetical protein QVD17_10915 [Tagetes erecta]|uniref:Uncharacterized protein n=1 Tax=Tagetes erecta TaxID=13708 RepID=A0AAD8P6M4_TARER|nr:hypothetical protein QVD17_10915 [Tagetes erecta]